MPERISIHEHKDEIVAAIDRYSWKHSWYLPTDGHGCTDWNNPKTLEDCLNVLEPYRDDAIDFAAKCSRLAKTVKAVIKQREEMEADCA